MPGRRPHLFSVVGDVLTPSLHTRGPWDQGLQHGGAVSGALGWLSQQAVDRTDNGDRFALGRLTVDLVRPVPVVPLRFETSVVRAGRRARLISARLLDGDTVVACSTSQWGRTRPGPVVDAEPDRAVPRRPTERTDPGAGGFDYPRPGFNCDAFELRCLEGTTEHPGPGTVWARLAVDIVAGEPVGPVARMATVADLANAVGWEPSPRGELMINSDVTLQLLRYPVGEWICLQARARSTSAGIGMMEAVLWDGEGRFGRVLSTTVENVGAELPVRERDPGQRENVTTTKDRETAWVRWTDE